MAGSCFILCDLCKPDCERLYKNQCERQRLDAQSPTGNVGKVDSVPEKEIK